MILIVDKITIINILIILILKIFFKKIFFLTTSKNLKKKSIYNFLKKIKIYWVNYEELIISDHTIKKKNQFFFLLI